MKKPKAKKLRKVWVIQPKTRVHVSGRRKIREKIERREAKDDLSGGF